MRIFIPEENKPCAKKVVDYHQHHILYFHSDKREHQKLEHLYRRKTRTELWILQVRGCERPLFTLKKVARSPSLQPLTKIEQKLKPIAQLMQL